MKTLLKSLVLVALGAVMVYRIGVAAEGAGAPAAAQNPNPGCSRASTDNAAGPPMAEKMKAHLEGMKSALAALRESEKTLAATDDPKAFRAAVIGHLKGLDDLQASHLAHMESMMERMPGGMPGMHRARGAGCGCEECRCHDCKCGGYKDKDCRGRHGCCECCGEGGHAR